MAAAPHVRPAPKVTRTTLSPLPNLPVRRASSKAMATAAAEVLPYFSILMNTLSSGMERRWGHGVDDAEVGLVGNDQLDVVRRQAGAFNHAGGGILHAGNCLAEGLLAAHGEGSQAFVGVLHRGGAAGAAARNLEQVMQGAVRADVRSEDGAFPFLSRGSLEHGGSGRRPRTGRRWCGPPS